MKKILLYGHADSENRGCQAIVESVSTLIKNRMQNNAYIGLTSSLKYKDENKFDNVDEVLIHDYFQIHTLRWAVSKIYMYILKNQKKSLEIMHQRLINNARSYDIALSVGGDNYCYDKPRWLFTLNDMLYKSGIKLVMFGCSVEADKIDDEMKADLAKNSLIVARETMSYDTLKNLRLPSKIILAPDTAFSLERIENEYTKSFSSDKKTIGINISALLENYEKDSGIVFKNYYNLINHILNNSDSNIILIPHVFCSASDDRVITQKIADLFNNNERIKIVEKRDCRELKQIISQCDMFIGGRTHSTIAAYSSCVPTLVLGYSVKSKGIAKDLFGSYDHYVLPTEDMITDDYLLNGFIWLEKNEEKIREHLNKIMPEYISRTNVILDELEKL